jgi:hypothetical protein
MTLSKVLARLQRDRAVSVDGDAGDVRNDLQGLTSAARDEVPEYAHSDGQEDDRCEQASAARIRSLHAIVDDI